MTWRAGLVTTFLLALAHAPVAHASTATVTERTLTFIAAPGEKNTVSIAYDAGTSSYRITDSSAPVNSGPGCGAIDHDLNCVDADIQVIIVNLRDGEDRWGGGDIKVVPSIDGGPGNDALGGIGFLNGGDGNDVLTATDAGAVMDGGAGDDLLVGGAGDDVMDGGDGGDLLIGNDGNDALTGGPGLDRVDGDGDGKKTIDCQGRDDEIIQGAKVTRVNCAPAPRVETAVTHVSVSRLIRSGLPFDVNCDRPCAIGWELTIDTKLRKRLRLRSARIDRRVLLKDEDGFMFHAAPRQHFVADVLGAALERALKKVKSFKATLDIEIYGRNGLSVSQTKSVKIG